MRTAVKARTRKTKDRGRPLLTKHAEMIDSLAHWRACLEAGAFSDADGMVSGAENDLAKKFDEWKAAVEKAERASE